MKKDLKWFMILHTLLGIYAMGSVCSKFAAQQEFGSIPFILLYGGVIATLGVYAIGWQQVIKHLPLTTAYANKAVTVVWGMVLGVTLFREQITVRQLIASAVIIVGIILFITADKEDAK